MNLASRFGCGRTDFRGPGTNLFFASCEIGLQLEQRVSTANDPVQSGFVESEVVQKFGFVLIVQNGDLRLDRRADCHKLGALFVGTVTHRVEVRIVVEPILSDVCDIHHRLRSKQM